MCIISWLILTWIILPSDNKFGPVPAQPCPLRFGQFRPQCTLPELRAPVIFIRVRQRNGTFLGALKYLCCRPELRILLACLNLCVYNIIQFSKWVVIWNVIISSPWNTELLHKSIMENIVFTNYSHAIPHTIHYTNEK